MHGQLRLYPKLGGGSSNLPWQAVCDTVQESSNAALQAQGTLASRPLFERPREKNECREQVQFRVPFGGGFCGAKSKKIMDLQARRLGGRNTTRMPLMFLWNPRATCGHHVPAAPPKALNRPRFRRRDVVPAS